jgi:hypothetical protein
VNVTGYLVGGVWVSDPVANLTFIRPPEGGSAQAAPFPLVHVQRGVIAVRLADDNGSGSDGMIGGIVDASELAFSILDTAHDPKACAESFSTVAQVKGAADSLLSGTHDETKACDALSLGAAFTMKRVALGPPAALAFPPSYTCK